MKVITVTLNPAFDVYCFSENFGVHRENLLKIISRDAGGKGINIGRALSAFSVEVENLVAVGEDNGEELVSRLLAEGLSLSTISLPGRIRENITVSSDTGPETRISFTGFSADDSLFESALSAILPSIEAGDVVTFSGRLPAGLTHDGVMAFLRAIKKSGARLVLDSHALGRDDIISLSPWLIKPNEEEMERYIGKCRGREDIAHAAKELVLSGIENVMVSLGKDGAVLANSDGVFFKDAPSISVKSTVGAGDSSIAGFIYASLRGKSGEDLLRYAVAFGSGACMKAGTAAPDIGDVEEILSKI